VSIKGLIFLPEIYLSMKGSRELCLKIYFVIFYEVNIYVFYFLLGYYRVFVIVFFTLVIV